jgi:hypothetical protein
MGQYFKPVIIDKKDSKKVVASLHPHDFANGLKIMEHSYVGNIVVNTFATLINDEDGKYKGYPMVWCGDYAKEVDGKSNYYDIARDNDTDEDVEKLKVKEYRYFINKTKKEFVDIEDCPSGKSSDDLIVHPLPILTSMGVGSYDYYPNNGEFKFIGSWANNVVVSSNKCPNEKTYKRIKPNFHL